MTLADAGHIDSTGADSAPTLDVAVRATLGALELDVELRTRARAVAVVGPSGCGKSTLLRVLAGVESRARGTVRFRGETWQDEDGPPVPPWQRQVGWVPQSSVLFPHLTVGQNLAYAGVAADEVREVASLLGVASLLDRRPRKLSGGEQQRVALGRALLSRPRLLLLDEPFAALDRPRRAEIAALVVRLSAERDVPLVLVSHDEEDVAAVVEERWVLSRGRLRART